MKEFLGLETAQRTIRTATGEYWDVRLTPTKETPFPLAPVGFNMNVETYRRENKAWGHFVSEIMHYESFIRSICILGFGLGRDTDWIPSRLRERGQHVIVDYSHVACENARAFLKKNGASKFVKILQTEVMEAWKNSMIDEATTQAYFMSQFLEHQGDGMPDFMHHLGSFLKTSGKIVYLITPTREDNPEVLWNHATPFLEKEWRVELSSALEEQAEVESLGKHKYFDRMYTFFKLSKA